MAEMNKRYFEEMLDLEREFDVFGAVHDKNGLTMQMTQTTVAFMLCFWYVCKYMEI